MTFDEKLADVAKRLPTVFTPASPVTDVRILRGRDTLRQDIHDAIARRGSSIVLYGERGAGKSSIAEIVAQFTGGDTCYYAASGNDTFDSIVAACLNHYSVEWVGSSREASKETSGKLAVPKSGIGLERKDATKRSEKPIADLQATPQQVVQMLPDSATLIVVDEFERMTDKASRGQFAELIKKLSDNKSETTLMIVGIASDLDELLGAHESAFRSITEIVVDRLEDQYIGEIVDAGAEALGIAFAADVRQQIVEFSARFPYYTHLLAEGCVRAFLDRAETHGPCELQVEATDLNKSVSSALRSAQGSIVRAYADAIRSIQGSPRFKHCLYAIASWPDDPVAYGDICGWVGGLEVGEGKSVNVSHQLKRLCETRIIRLVSKGFYTFENPLLKAYVILRARQDTSDAELRAIDAQLDHVRKRIDRLKQRPSP